MLDPREGNATGKPGAGSKHGGSACSNHDEVLVFLSRTPPLGASGAPDDGLHEIAVDARHLRASTTSAGSTAMHLPFLSRLAEERRWPARLDLLRFCRSRTMADAISLAFIPPKPGNAMTATLSSLLTSAATLLAPEPTTLTMTVSAIDITNTTQGTCCSALVRWSFTQGGTLRPCATQMTALPSTSDDAPAQIPTDLLPTGTALPAPLSIIVSDVGYTYQPILSQDIVKFAPTMQRTDYMLPRATGQVAVGTLPASGIQHGQVCY